MSIMKRFLFSLTCLFLLGLSLEAQDSGLKSSFLFPEYHRADILFKDNAVYHEQMNYNLVEDKFYFIDRNDGQVKVLSNPQDIALVAFGDRKFRFLGKGNDVVEILSTNPAFYVHYKGNVRKEAPKGAYGFPSETASVKSVGTVYNGVGKAIVLEPSQLIVSKIFKYYWVQVAGKEKQFHNAGQFLKLFKKQQAELKSFIEKNHTDFDDVEQVKRLFDYAMTIQ